MSEKDTQQKRTLVLFSGGMDSFVTACRCIEDGEFVGLLFCNGGYVVDEENILHSVARLHNRYGENALTYEGAVCTAGIIKRLSEWWEGAAVKELAVRFPNMRIAQMQCLHCQTAMWVAAIAMARARNYDKICAGCRSDDIFCTGSERFQQAMDEIANEFGIHAMFPVLYTENWEAPWSQQRQIEMENRGFLPRVLEPKCMIGRPVTPLDAADKAEMRKYFDEVLRDKIIRARGLIARLVPTYTTQRPSPVSLDSAQVDIIYDDGGLH